jgi:hypothetical protein
MCSKTTRDSACARTRAQDSTVNGHPESSNPRGADCKYLPFVGSSTHGSMAASPAIPIAGPLVGKTYTLYGQASTSDEYFRQVDALLDACLRRWPGTVLLAELVGPSTSERRLARAARLVDSPVNFACAQAEDRLASYFLDVAAHRASLSLIDHCSKTLAMTREQYFLCAVEIELRNRLNLVRFAQCGEPLALLPHCLRDLAASCRAKPRGIDTMCMGCSASCYLNQVSRLLRRHRVQPYIWMSANLGKLLRQRANVLGVLGIACIPELARGMRRCARAGVPVLGLPLDANRCARWLGELRPNSVNLNRLETLLVGASG